VFDVSGILPALAVEQRYSNLAAICSPSARRRSGLGSLCCGRRCGRLGECAAAQERSEQGPEHHAAIVAWNHAEALHSPLRHAAIVRLPVGRHPGRQLLVSRKVVAAVGRAAAKLAIR
jgi:hypothetical protein